MACADVWNVMQSLKRNNIGEKLWCNRIKAARSFKLFFNEMYLIGLLYSVSALAIKWGFYNPYEMVLLSHIPHCVL